MLSPIRKNMLLTLFCFMALAGIWSCTSPVAGGTSEETNAISGQILDSLGNPVPGLAVALRPQEFRVQTMVSPKLQAARLQISFEYERWDTTDAGGQWHFGGVVPGSYVLSSQHDDGRIAYRAVQKNLGILELSPDTLHRPGELRGQVALRWDVPHGVRVQIPGTTFFTTTDSVGKFHLLPVPRSIYSLSVTSPDPLRYASALFQVEPQAQVPRLIGPMSQESSLVSGQSVQDSVFTLPMHSEYAIISWWNFDYLRYVSSEGSFYDVRGRSPAAILYGGAVQAEGISQKALRLNGASQFAVVHPAPAGLDNAQSLSLEAWVRLHSLPDTGAFVGNVVGKLGFGIGQPQDVFSLAVVRNYCGVSGPALAFFLGDGTGTLGCAQMIADTLATPLEHWVHVLAAWDGNSKKLFVNGRQVATGLTSFTQLSASGESLYFGKENLVFDLDEVRLVGVSLQGPDAFYRWSLLATNSTGAN